MPFEKGNKLGKGRPRAGQAFSDALRVAVSERGPDGQQKLRKLADVLLDRALSGDVQAIRDIADRLDGKTVPVTYGDEHTRAIVVQFLDADRGIF